MTALSPADPRICSLGEGPLWSPEHDALYWVDINANRLLRSDGAAWDFDGAVSALGRLGGGALLVAHERGLLRFDPSTGARETLARLEADDPGTRSNDGRADPWGGFWIGVMGKGAEPGRGALYRWFRGEMRRVVDRLTIPNAVAFAPDGDWMTFTDTPTGKIWSWRLNAADGWPVGEPAAFLDLARETLRPDGAVFDAEGGLWVALYGAGRLDRFGADAARTASVSAPAAQVTCPAFGGEGLAILYATTAAQGLSDAALAERPDSGRLMSADVGARGVPEPLVIP